LTLHRRLATIYLEFFRNRSNHGILRDHESHLRSTTTPHADLAQAGTAERRRDCAALPFPLCCHGLLSSELLKKASLITESKYKNFIYYELNASVFEEIMLWCAQFTGGTDENQNEAD
jgi:hypothetical protein